jgi:hypothetical protein
MDSNTPVEDFVVATSDRRRELRGARWDGLRQGSTASLFPLSPEMDRTRLHPRFEKGVSFETHEAIAHSLPEPFSLDDAAQAARSSDSCAARKLATLLHHAAWPQRWEPLNGCGQHRAVGTPGALFPVDLYLLARTRNGMRALYCSPRDLCLLEAGALPDAAAQDTAEALSLIIVGNLGRCVAIYGDLALWLVVLEAGMLQAQLQLAASALGWRLESDADHDYAQARALTGLGHWSEVPLLRCRLPDSDATAAVLDLPQRRLATIRPRPHHAEAEQHPLMRQFVQLAAAPVSRAAAAPDLGEAGDAGKYKAEKDNFSVMDLSATRSSGPGNGIGRWTQDLTPERLETLLADTRRLLRDCGPLTIPLAVSLVWRQTQSGPVKIFDLDPAQARMTAQPCSAETLSVARGMCRYNTGLLLTIGADVTGTVAAAGARGLIAVNLQAGALAQCFSLAAARSGLSARLFMAYPDDLKNLLMPLRARALVQILIGFDARANPAFLIT